MGEKISELWPLFASCQYSLRSPSLFTWYTFTLPCPHQHPNAIKSCSFYSSASSASTSVHHTWHAVRTRRSMKIAVLLYGHHSWDHTWMDSSLVLMWFKSKLHLGGYVLSDHDKYMSMPHARGRETVQIGTAWYMDITPLFSGQQREFSHRGGAPALLEQVLQFMLTPWSKNCHYLESYSIRVVELESIWWTLFIYSIFMVNSMLFSYNLCIHWMHSFRVENCRKELLNLF